MSRDTFYRYKEAVVSDGVEALIEKSRRKPNRKNRGRSSKQPHRGTKPIREQWRTERESGYLPLGPEFTRR